MIKNKYFKYFLLFLLSVINIGFITITITGYSYYTNFKNDGNLFYDKKIDDYVKENFNIKGDDFHIYFGNVSNMYISGINKILIEKEVYNYKNLKENNINDVILHEIIHYKMYNLNRLKMLKVLFKLKENKKLIDQLILDEINNFNSGNKKGLFNNKLVFDLYLIDSELNNYLLSKNNYDDNILVKKYDDDINLYKERIELGLQRNIFLLNLTYSYSSLDEYITYFYEDFFDIEKIEFYIPENYLEYAKGNKKLLKILDNYKYFLDILNDEIN